MKKFLSLVLSLAMAMSLVTISAGAKDFTDDSKIAYKEAVDVISAIDVVDGYTDGSFNPTNQLTRGAAAKIICNLVLGPTTADALSADTAPFSDVPVSNEFSGYIAYCSQQGIINGYSDGTFRPAGTLTGYAFMKMLLGALGYDGEVEGFTGPNWSVQVAKLALGAGLDDGNEDFVGTAPVTREEACLYSFNTLQANMVEYDARTSVSVGGAEVVIAGSKAENIPQAGSGYDNTMNDSENVVQFAERYFPKLTRTRNNTDDMGRPAVEWKYRSEIIGKYADDSDLIGSWTAKAPKNEMYSLVGGSIVDDLTIGTKSSGKWSVPSEYSFTAYVDGEEISRDTLAADPDLTNYFARNDSSAAGTQNAVSRGTNVGVSGNGVLTELYMDDDNNVTVVMINTYLVKATADYNSTKESITVEAIDTDETVKSNYNNMVLPTGMDTSIDQEDFDVSGVKEGDYLLVTWSVDADNYVTVEPATVKTGVVTEYTERDNVIVDGEKLSYARLTGDTEQEEQFSINSEASLVLDAYGYILYVDDANSTSSYVFVNGIQGKTNLNKDAVADAYFTDGTAGEIDIKKLYNEAGNSYDSGKTIIANGTVGWYTFTKDSNDKYTLTAVKDWVSGTDKRYEDRVVATQGAGTNDQIVYSSRVNFLGNEVGQATGTKPRANSDTLFLVLDADDSLTVYTGVSNAPDVTLSAAGKTAPITYVVDTNGYAKYVFIDVSNDPDADIDGANNIADYMFVLNDNGKRTFVEGDEYRQYQVIIDGEETTRFIAESLVGGDGSATGKVFYDIKVNEKDYITDSTKVFVDQSVGTKDQHVVLNLSDATISQKSGSITFGSDSFLADSATEIHMNVRAKALMKDKGNSYESYPNTTIGTVAGLCTNYDVTGTVYVVLDGDYGTTDRADYIFVNITGVVASDDETASTPALTKDEANKTSYAAGEKAEALKVTVDNINTMKNPYNLTYEVKNSAGSTVVSSATVPTNGEITFYPAASQSAGQTPVAETYTVTVTNTDASDANNKASSSVSIKVEVSADAKLESFTVQSATNTYKNGESFDTANLILNAVYTDGSKVVSGASATVTPEVLTMETTEVTITFEGISVKYPITVEARDSVISGARTATVKVDESTYVAVSASNGGTIDATAVVTNSNSYDNSKITATYADGVLTITAAADASAGDYKVTVSGKDEAGDPISTPLEITLTVSAG